MTKILGRFTGQIAQSNERFTITNCLVGSKSKSKPVAMETNPDNKSDRSHAFEGQITPSNKMFAISKLLIGSKATSEPAAMETFHDESGRSRAFEGQITPSNKMFAVSMCFIGSKSMSESATTETTQDKFGRFRAFEGQITQSNKMFTISKYFIGLKSQSEPAPVSSLDRVRSRNIREKAGSFRVLILGRANAGKTTILEKVCNTVEEPDIFDVNGIKVQSRSTTIGIEPMILTKYCSSD